MTDSIASETRAAVRARPWLLWGLRAGVVNFRAAAETLAVDADPDSVATALRRYAEELEPADTESRRATVRMQSGVDLVEGADGRDGDADGRDGDTDTTSDDDIDDTEDVVVRVGDARVVRGGSMTAIRASGDVDAAALGAVLARLETTSVLVDAAGVAGSELVVVVPRRQGATALRVVEESLERVPN